MFEVLFTGLVFCFFLVATGALAIYGLHLYVLVWLFRRRVKAVREGQKRVISDYWGAVAESDWPAVTTQIPLYNELDVAGRIIRAVADLDYPAGRHEIQVLDDSDDRTRDVIDEVVGELRGRGAEIQVLRRSNRSGYKAGALALGVERARGRYVAVFDADFVPARDFLRRAIPLLERSPDVACVQGRWAHLNEEASWLTRAQALGIDGHFAVEQGARAWNGLMMNFNGTAGVWRKAAIDDPAAGGWAGDTLTEDLDLSYRVQLAGWRLDYCLDLAAPAELPSHVKAFKSQQRRWATGSIQVAVKLLPRIWRAPLGLGQKIEATLHLTHYTVAIWMLILAVLARPMLFLTVNGDRVGDWLWVLWCVVFVSAAAPAATYTYARYTLGGGFSGIALVPQMMVLGCGMCLNNALAVIRGVRLRGGEFVRTPKTGGLSRLRAGGSYRPLHNHLWVWELGLGVWSLTSLAYYMLYTKWLVSVFLLLYGAGFLTVGWLSRPWGACGHAAGSSKTASPEPVAASMGAAQPLP